MRWVAAVAHQDGSALQVDVLHVLGRQGDPTLRVHHAYRGTSRRSNRSSAAIAFKAALDAIDLLHAVGVEHHHQLPDHIIEPRAEAAAGHDGGGHVGGLEVELAPRAGLEAKDLVRCAM